MDEIVAKLDGVIFDFEEFMRETWGEGKSNEICKYYLRGTCEKGKDCPNKHIKSEKAVVCKHWLRGLCKKGDQCEFLHEYNLSKMPECYFFSNFGECSNGDDCPFLHIDPRSKIKTCAWFVRGFCRHGPRCRHRHIKKPMCTLYLAGFCPDGPNCKLGHPKFDIPTNENEKREVEGKEEKRIDKIKCFKCTQYGHFANRCPN